MNGQFSGSGRKNPHPKGKKGGVKQRKGKLLKLPQRETATIAPAQPRSPVPPTRSYAGAIETGREVHDPFGGHKRWEPGEA